MRTAKVNRVRGPLVLAFVGLSSGLLLAKEPLVLSPSAVVDTVKENSLAAKGGMKARDVVAVLNGQTKPGLEEVLACRFDWEKGRETVLSLRRGDEDIQARLPQGDWGCEFRADLSGDSLERLAAAREALKKKETWAEGQKAWEALADEALKAGFSDTACWLGLELGKALTSARHGKEAQAVLEKWGRSAPKGSYWALAAGLETGRACIAAEDPDGASKAFARAGDAAKSERQELRLATVLVKLFNFELNRGRLPEAKEAAEKVLAIRERLAPGTLLLSEGFQNLGMVTYKQGDLTAAKELFLKSLALKESLAPDSLITATNLNNLGAVAADQGDMKGARDFFRRALAIYERLAPDSLLLASSLVNLAIMDATEGDLALAKERMLKALAIRERLAPNSLELAHNLTNLAPVVIDLGDLPTAKKYYQQALAIYERLAPDSLQVAHCLAAMSNVYRKQGDLATAGECLTRALAIQERLAPKSLDVAGALIDLSSVMEERGDLASASELLARALAIQESVAPDGLAVAVSLDSLGNVTRKQGDLPMAREYYLKALAIRERLTPDALETAYIYTNLGALALDRGDMASARDFHLKALATMEKLAPDGLDVADSLSDLGAVVAAQGDLASAKDTYLRALAIKERLAPDSLGVAYTRNGLGTVLRKQGDLGAARENLDKAVVIYGRLAPGSRGQANSLRNLALTEKAAGKLSVSADLLAKAVDALEAQRSRVGGESAKASFSSVTGEFYTDLIAAYLDTKRPPQALETLERSRARTMLEMVSSRYVDLKGEIPEALLERQRELAGLRRSLSDKLARADAKTPHQDVESWRADLLLLPQKEDLLAAEIRKSSPRLAALEYPKPLDYRGIVSSLEPGTLLVAYAVTEEETYLFTLLKRESGKEAFSAVRLPVGAQTLEKRARLFRAMMSAAAAAGRDQDAWKSSAADLYGLLLSPASKEIAASQRILILPDGALHLLPFTALIPSDKKLPRGLEPAPLGLQRPISIQASMTVYSELKVQKTRGAATRKGEWIGFGDPIYPSKEKESAFRGEVAQVRMRGFDLEPLPGTRREIEEISALFGANAKAFLGGDATEEAVRKLPRETPYVHLACHGLIDSEFPMNSALALSIPPAPEPGDAAAVVDNRKDGLLEAWEIIQDVKLESDCVVLSACETGVGKILGGEGVTGLTRAFFYAGAESVVVSLWPIADESAAMLMEAYYKEILAGAPRDVALQRAQNALAKSERYSHPFHWAAFELHGMRD